MNCNTPTDVTFSFTGFAQRGGRTDHHVDGWGIAFFEGAGLRHFVDHQPASESPVAELIRRYPIKSRNVIAHIRKATQGAVALQNCHPFVRELWGRYWVFAHNGNLENFHPRLHASFRPVGATDSERAFCWLMQELAKSHAGVPSVPELTLTLRELTPQIARHGPFNFMLSSLNGRIRSFQDSPCNDALFSRPRALPSPRSPSLASWRRSGPTRRCGSSSAFPRAAAPMRSPASSLPS